MFFCSSFLYAYQGAINTARFDGPTRALNSILSSAGAIVGAILFGYIVLDSKRFGRRTRGYIALAVVAALTIIIRVCNLLWQVSSLLGRGPCPAHLFAGHVHACGSRAPKSHQL